MNVLSITALPGVRFSQDMPEYEWDIYEKSVPMSTYLVAFAVTDLAVRESDPGLSNTLFRGQLGAPEGS